MPLHFLPDATRTARMTTDELREAFLVQGLFVPGRLTMRLVDLDRVVLGGAVPTSAPLRLEPLPDLKADYFCERRELGVLNIGGPGTVTVDGTAHALDKRDVLYVGRGSRAVSFASNDAAKPARFYLISYPAHADYPTTAVRRAESSPTELGTMERANRRVISKYIHAAGARSAQLVMGVTELLPGSVWNTMPAHT